jgi:hypothetical protein
MSTATLAADMEVPDVVVQRTRRMHGQDVNSIPGPSKQNTKRARSPGSGSSEGDDEYLPRKRVRSGRSSTRIVHAVRRLSIHLIR